MLEPHKSFKFDFYPISEKIKAHCWAFFKVTQLLYGSARIFFCLFFLFVCFFKSLPLIRFPDSSVGKESFCNAGDSGWIPGSERSPGEGISYPLQYSWASLVAQLVKNLPAMWETWVRSLGWEDPLEKGKATHSSILTLRIPWTVWSIGSQRVRHIWMIFTSLYFTIHPRNQDWFEKRQRYFKDNEMKPYLSIHQNVFAHNSLKTCTKF